MASLAEVCRVQGRLEESAALYRQALEWLEQAWGPENPQLLPTLRSYSLVLRARQEYAQAEELEVRSVRIRVVEALRSSQ